MKINLKKTKIIVAFATLALSSSPLCFGSKLTPYHMQIVGKYFESAKDYKNLFMVSKKYEKMGEMYRKNFINVSQEQKDKYFPYIETYVAYPGVKARKLKGFSKNIKHMIYLENSFNYAKFVEILRSTGIINLSYDGEITFDSENWECKELGTESKKGFILFFKGIGEKNKEETLEFHFDPIKFAVMKDGSYDIDIGIREYNLIVDDASNILNVLGVEPKILKVSGITAVNIPQSVTEIKDSSFYSYYGLQEIILPNTIKTIGESAFHSCMNLKKIKLPDTLKKISNGAFQSCTHLKEIEIPNSVEEIGESAFDFCIEINKIEIPNSVKKLGKGCFLNCASLIEISVPGSIKNISKAAFACCGLLKKVVISEGVESIGPDAFANCPLLSHVSIPLSVKEIDVNAFSDCGSLNEIKYGGNVYHSLNSFMTAFKAKRNVQDC